VLERPKTLANRCHRSAAFIRFGFRSLASMNKKFGIEQERVWQIAELFASSVPKSTDNGRKT